MYVRPRSRLALVLASVRGAGKEPCTSTLGNPCAAAHDRRENPCLDTLNSTEPLLDALGG